MVKVMSQSSRFQEENELLKWSVQPRVRAILVAAAARYLIKCAFTGCMASFISLITFIVML